MRELRERGWLATSPLGYFVLDREAAAFFLRTRSGDLPGHEDRRDVRDRATARCTRRCDRNILHINGADHRRLRNLVNPAFTPRAADRWRPAMREFLERAVGAARRRRDGCEFVEAFAKPYPSLTIATVMGAPLEDAPRLHDGRTGSSASSTARAWSHERARIERRGARSSTSGPASCSRAAREDPATT